MTAQAAAVTPSKLTLAHQLTTAKLNGTNSENSPCYIPEINNRVLTNRQNNYVSKKDSNYLSSLLIRSLVAVYLACLTMLSKRQ